MDISELAPSCRFLCPRERFEKDKYGKKVTINRNTYRIIEISYQISNVEDEIMSHLHSLLCLNNEEGEENKFYCWICARGIKSKTYYRCNSCEEEYHKECVECPSMFQYSDHPKHQLQLLWIVEGYYSTRECPSCESSSGYLYYGCSFCDFLVHPICAKNPTPLTINNHKRHKHTLHYFPRKSNLVCDVCALEGGDYYVYVCLLCDFVVHKKCVLLPYVIKISRHNHRLIFNHNHPQKEWTRCGVCHLMIKGNYGYYSCMRGCTYGVHSRCGTQKKLWDEKELEGIPEETYENVEMVEEKGDGIIKHLSHPHHQMRLDKNIKGVYNENKHCQACVLPVYDDDSVYQCMECDFIFHESCAYIPRVKEFMLHIHPLILDYTCTSCAMCWACDRYSCGFRYACRMCNFVLDTRCASICEPFDYHSHPHPLLVTSKQRNVYCSVCKSHLNVLDCIDSGECDFVLCFRCATLPLKARYENDDHLLTFSYKNDGNDESYWCDICEEDINLKKGFYGCSKCGVAFHIDCILGKDPYMKPGKSYQSGGNAIIDVLPNIYSSRPICKKCKKRCLYNIKIKSSVRTGIFCSVYCLLSLLFENVRY